MSKEMSFTDGMISLVKMIDRLTGDKKKTSGTISVQETFSPLGNNCIIIEFIPRKKKGGEK